MERYICIHAHFYQPPRENPWLEAIELQDSAYPYHDWNERITAECYAPNMTSRILDEAGRIEELVNNYSRISFNFGPTLLSWLESEAPDVYRSILEADQESQQRFSGHGSAMAQAYNHMILPLANRRDKKTQVCWGIRDFVHRFKRQPEGMWLPETAVDVESLEVLAEEGIRFTILAPHQASRVRKIGSTDWEDVAGQQIDPTRAYSIRLPSGKSMTLFFYDGPISRAVAFEQLLTRGETFARRIAGGFSEDRQWAQMLHIATDGETYGHHHRFGDMALAYALHFIESKGLARLTNYGEFLENHPPTHEVEIFDNTSWSCAHGIERWRSNCHCSSGMRPDWTQEWRAPLRKALDWLRDTLAESWQVKGNTLLKDPWEARDHYIDLILDPTPDRIDAFMERFSRGPWNQDKKTAVLRLMELQRHAMLMYTSCGWFFDELSGIETIQIIRYAARALQLAMVTFGGNLEPRFLALLEKARSNIPEEQNGRKIYQKHVASSRVDLKKVGAHYAMTSLFEDYPDDAQVYCYNVERKQYQVSEAGKAKLAVGCARFTSRITDKAANLSFGVLHLGDHNITCGVREYRGEPAFTTFSKEVFQVFERADFAESIRILDRHFGPTTYSLKSLFRDEQRKIMDTILASTLDAAEASYRQLYENHAPLMRFLQDSGVPLPKALHVAAEFIFNTSLRRSFDREETNPETLIPLLEEARIKGIPLDQDTLEYALRRCMERIVGRFRMEPEVEIHLLKLEQAVDLLKSLPFSPILRTVQNLYYEILNQHGQLLQVRAERGDDEAQAKIRRMSILGEALSIKIPSWQFESKATTSEEAAEDD